MCVYVERLVVEHHARVVHLLPVLVADDGASDELPPCRSAIVVCRREDVEGIQCRVSCFEWLVVLKCYRSFTLYISTFLSLLRLFVADEGASDELPRQTSAIRGHTARSLWFVVRVDNI